MYLLNFTGFLEFVFHFNECFLLAVHVSVCGRNVKSHVEVRSLLWVSVFCVFLLAGWYHSWSLKTRYWLKKMRICERGCLWVAGQLLIYASVHSPCTHPSVHSSCTHPFVHSPCTHSTVRSPCTHPCTHLAAHYLSENNPTQIVRLSHI